jgi:CRISPR type III-B/RAMP module RAMP protein Cmr1
MRRGPEAPAAWPAATLADEHSRTFPVRALTPIYKGGANPKGIDEGLPFRGPTLRGALRSWWRATTDEVDKDRLRERELRLFGGVFVKPPVASKVIVIARDNRSVSSDKAPPELGYALWVDRGRDSGVARYHVDASATIQVRCPTDAKDAIERALKAWLLLGGVGSRSRRGLGSVWTEEAELVPRFTGGEDWARAVRLLVPAAGSRPWPSLSGIRLLTAPGTFISAVSAVQKALDDMHDVRGMRKQGGVFTGAHRQPEFQKDWLAVKDGRGTVGATAALGLPLPYRSSTGHFQGGRIAEPVGENRLPSPVLIKPVRLANGQYVAGIAVLRLWAFPKVAVSHTSVTGQVREEGLDALVRGLRGKQWTLQEVS